MPDATAPFPAIMPATCVPWPNASATDGSPVTRLTFAITLFLPSPDASTNARDRRTRGLTGGGLPAIINAARHAGPEGGGSDEVIEARGTDNPDAAGCRRRGTAGSF